MKNNKIGILYICTGQYSLFWNDFFLASEKFFFTEPDIEKHYFVFTDDTSIQSSANVHVYYKKPEGFPADSLKRFELFLSIKDHLLSMDFVFFLNANMRFIQKVGKEILPINYESGLMGVLHPGYYRSKKDELPYERNPKSQAYIPYIKGIKYHYFMGGFNGGKTEKFIELCEVCQQHIMEDNANNIIAAFHDESHINAYFLQKKIHILQPEYGFPEDLPCPFSPKIIILNKSKHYGNAFIKEYANPFLLPSPFKKRHFLKDIQKFISDIFNKLFKW